MDPFDTAIVEVLRRGGRMTVQELADRVGLAPASTLERVQRLEAAGEITGATVGRMRESSFEVFIHADVVVTDLTTVEAFEESVAAMEEVVELRRMFGLPAYFIRVRTVDAASFERWLTTRLMVEPAVVRVDTRLTMKVIKALR